MTPGGPPPAPTPVPTPAPTPLSAANPAFVATACALMALVSLSIDTILPGLQDLASELGAAEGNRRQWVITALFLGMVAGQLFYGPLSDSIGRRKGILLGVAVFSAGSMISATAQSFEAMLLGRVLQGFGVAGPRTVTVAMIRDRFEGAAMARLMSLIMGLTFGNFNAMALQPFGHLAGAAAAVQATVLTSVSLIMAAVIGNLFDGTLVPVLAGYLVLGLAALVRMRSPG